MMDMKQNLRLPDHGSLLPLAHYLEPDVGQFTLLSILAGFMYRSAAFMTVVSMTSGRFLNIVTYFVHNSGFVGTT
jgi:hypothetical protein